MDCSKIHAPIPILFYDDDEQKLQYREDPFQLTYPVCSSHSSMERMLPMARAMLESAAP